MRSGKQLLFHILIVALVAVAGAAPAAQAGGPDDRPLYRGLSPASIGPDDRPLYRGTSASLEPRSVSPDDRAFARSVAVERPAPLQATATVPSGFDWIDALIGATFGLALATIGAGCFLVAGRHRHSGLRSA
jgi:hypothetical protein